MNRVHHDMQDRIDDFLRLFRVEPLHQPSRAAYVSKEHGDLLPFSFQGMPRRQDLFGQMFGKVGVGRGRSGGRSRSGCRSRIDRVTAIAAELRGAAVGLAAFRTGCFETRPALVTKSGVGNILVLATRAIHISMSLRSDPDIVRVVS